MANILHHQVAPQNDNPAGFEEFNTIDWELMVEGRKLLKNSIVVEADIVVYSAGTTALTPADRIGLENKLYINGVLDVSGASGSFNPTPMTNLRIGASALFGFPFNGNIDEPCFFNRKLIQNYIMKLTTCNLLLF